MRRVRPFVLASFVAFDDAPFKTDDVVPDTEGAIGSDHILPSRNA